MGESTEQTAQLRRSFFFFFFFFMGRTVTRLSCFCRNRAAAGIRLGSLQLKLKPKPKPSPAVVEADPRASAGKDSGRRIMVVVGSEPEAKGALQWALSHSVLGNDTLVLVSVVKPARRRDQSQKQRNSRRYQALHAMQSMCQTRRPEIKVELTLVEGRERGPAIVDEARKQGASLLVLGQRKRSITWRLLTVCSGNRIRGGGGVADYCIQNASCMTLAVRRKSRRGGGYLITTKHRKNFWLLA